MKHYNLNSFDSICTTFYQKFDLNSLNHLEHPIYT